MNKKTLLNRIIVGIGIAALIVAIVVIAALSVHYHSIYLRGLDALIISVLILLSVIEMRRALGRERIPDNFSWLIWVYGFGITPSYVLFGYSGILFFTLLIFVLSTLTAFRINRADCLIHIAFMLVYPGLFMSSMLYINHCASTQPIAENSVLSQYVIYDAWTLIGAKRTSVLLPYNALGLAFVFAVSTMTDIFAYFIGSIFGKQKLAPSISPNKSIQGAIGGVFGGVLGSFIVYVLFEHFKLFGQGTALSIHGLSPFNLVLSYALIGFFGSIMTQIGDLLASFIKRYCGIKDFSRILGEHGGIIDRFDGIMLNATFVAIVYMFII